MIAMGNSGEKNFVPYITECLKDEEPLVRAHALWALWKIEGVTSKQVLINHRDIENNSIVIDEIDRILSSI